MPRKIITDGVTVKKSIRDIPISVEKEKKRAPRLAKVESIRKPVNPKFVIWVIALIAVMALFFGISLLFASVTLKVTPRVETVSFNNETYPNLPFEVLNISKTDSVKIEATEEKMVSQKASGKIVVYNNYSATAQRLINNTRFESANGKIYRIANSVDVPGTKVVSGKTVPGSVEVTVYADEPGEAYNMKLADMTGDFKIPGFKGTPRYNSFYARLKTDISGGVVGQQKVISAEARRTAEESLKASVKEMLIKELYAIKPENYIVFDQTYTIEYNPQPDTFTAGSKEVSINMQGDLKAYVFNSLKLGEYFGTKKLVNFDHLTANFIPSDTLGVNFSVKNELTLNGSAQIKWLYDPMAMKRDLVGRSASDTVSILSKYKKQVGSIEVLFQPVWTKYVPDDIDRIEVVEI